MFSSHSVVKSHSERRPLQAYPHNERAACLSNKWTNNKELIRDTAEYESHIRYKYHNNYDRGDNP